MRIWAYDKLQQSKMSNENSEKDGKKKGNWGKNDTVTLCSRAKFRPARYFRVRLCHKFGPKTCMPFWYGLGGGGGGGVTDPRQIKGTGVS